MHRKILVAVDGSVYSSNTIRYLGRLFEDLDDIFFHLLCTVPSTASDAGREWLEDQELLNVLDAESRQRFSKAKRHMNEMVLQFSRRGMDPHQISTEVKLARMGVTDDILSAAQKGLYDALVIGRRGLTKLEGMIMGSTSTNILEKCHDVPIWIVDGQVNSRKFLVPVDGSFETLKAVDHLAFILKDNPYAEITLFHSTAMFSQRQTPALEECAELFGREWCALHLVGSDNHFHGPEQLLLDSGFPAARLHRLETSKGLYASRQIVRQALIDGFGTIVMGRRGSEIKKGVFGSVSGKVVAMIEDVAIWLVG
ncbi:MAG: universal stress protein [Deltaproteobacteria bacterium RIFOXYD12_FULL_57_12]|nr:MAG: universal stress protein [Deltaproteobacteria bacterium RIFOXYD12_FULL_57_12]